MALSANTVWEIRTTGNAANSGGFVAGASGTDRSQQDSPHVTIDGASITATVNATTTILDIAGYTAIAADVGNLVRITGGTMTAGTYQITASGSGQWTIDRSGGTAGQTGTGRMGGAQSDPALVAAVMAAGNITYQQAGTYSITSASTNVAGGCVSLAVGASYWEGYQTTRGDFGTKPVLQASGISTATLFAIATNEVIVANVETDGASLTSLRGFSSASNRGVFYACTARNCTNSGYHGTGAGVGLIACFATGCATAAAFIVSGGAYGCVASDNTITGFSITAGILSRCIADSNTGASTDGFSTSTNGITVVNCVSYANGRHGFNMVTSWRVVNCIAEANGGFGLVVTGEVNVLLAFATYNNTSGATSGTFRVNRFGVTGAGSFFTNAANGDFSLNNTAGAGAAARAAGILGAFPGGTTTGYLDIGAAQHIDPPKIAIIGRGGLVD